MKIKELLMTDTCYYQVYKFLPWTNSKELGKMTLLSMLIDAESIASERLKGNYEYFQCTNKFLNTLYKAGWSKNTLDNYFNELKKDEYIDIQLVKIPNYTHAPRYVKINNQKLIEMYNLYNSQNLNNNNQELTVNNQDLTVNNQNLTVNNQNLYLNNNYKKELKQEQETNGIYGTNETPPNSILGNQKDIDLYKGGEQHKPNAVHAPTLEEVKLFAESEGLLEVNIEHFYKYYLFGDWKTSNGNLINWKQKLLQWNEDEKNKKHIRKRKVSNIPETDITLEYASKHNEL